MNFGYFLVVFVAVNSTCNCEVVNSTVNDNSTFSDHHPLVPWQIRFATMFFTNLFLSASIWLTTLNAFESDFGLAQTNRIAVTVFTGIHTFSYIGLGFSISLLIALDSNASMLVEQLWLLWMQQSDFCVLISFVLLVRLWPPNIDFQGGNLPIRFQVVYVILNFLSPILIIFGVYMKLFSALIPMAILLVISYVGAVLIESRVGQWLWHTATINLMLFVNIKLLTTLNSALQEGKSIWPLITTVIKAILMIFAIRSVSNELIGIDAGNQGVFEPCKFRLLQLAIQLSLSCLLCYFICLIYSLYTQ